MEDVSVKAITIGVGIFMAIMTMTAVLTYYNTAKDAVREIGSGTDIAGLYEKSIEDILLKKKVSGTDIKNILNYFAGRKDVKIYVAHLHLYNNAFNGSVTYGEHSIKTDYSYNINDGIQNDNVERTKVIKFILPNSTYDLDTPTVINGITTISIH